MLPKSYEICDLSHLESLRPNFLTTVLGCKGERLTVKNDNTCESLCILQIKRSLNIWPSTKLRRILPAK